MSAVCESESPRQRAGERERMALERVVEYLWGDESADYEALPPHGRAGHIFEDLLCLKEWLRRVSELERTGFRMIVVREEGDDV